MYKNIKKVNLSFLFSLMLSMVFIPAYSQAAYIAVPGENADEVRIVMIISASTQESEVYSYLNNTAKAIKLTAAKRLGDIGTNYSLPVLEDMARGDNDIEVRNQAAFSAWKIKYRQAISVNDAELFLSSLLTGPSDSTKTVEVKAWAMQLLADSGVKEAMSVFEGLIETPGVPAVSEDYLRQTARQCLKVVQFINSFPKGVDIMEKINFALLNDELCIQQWGVRALVKQKPAGLKKKNLLIQHLEAARANKDGELVSYIAGYLDNINDSPALEFESPRNNAVVNSQIVTIVGRSYGEIFTDTKKLNFGKNIYTKTVDAVTGTLTLYRNNHAPVINPLVDLKSEIGALIKFTISANDADGDALSYSCFDLPAGAVFNENTHTFSWTPMVLGRYKVSFSALDQRGLSDTTEMSIAVTPLKAPSDLQAAANVTNQIHMAWKDNSRSEEGFVAVVNKKPPSTGPGAVNFVTTFINLPANATAYDYTVPAGDYSYICSVKAVYKGTSSNWSNNVEVSKPNKPILTAKLKSLDAATATAVIDLSWVCANAKDFVISYKGEGWVSYITLSNNLSGVNTYQASLPAISKYYFKMYARNGLGYTTSNEISVDAAIPNTPPLAPTNLKAEVLSLIEIKLTWEDNSIDESGFIIRRNGAELIRLERNTISYVDRTAQPSAAYNYEVAAVRKNDPIISVYSAYSNRVEVATALPMAPSSLTASSVPGVISLSWRYDTYRRATGFIIHRRRHINPLGAFAECARVAGDIRSYINTGIASSQYDYYVTAYNGVGESAASNQVTVNLVSGYTITFNAGQGGTIRPLDNAGLVPGTNIVGVAPRGNKQFIITSSPGYAIYQVLIDGRKIGLSAGRTLYTYTFSNVTANRSIRVNFMRR